MAKPENHSPAPTDIERDLFQTKLLNTWLDTLSSVKVSSLREPIINRPQFLELLQTAILEQKPLVFVAIGCQDWIKPDWGDPAIDRIMGRIKPDGKKAKRFVQEMASFSKALTSFDVPHRIHFSLSDIEPLLNFHLQNMGLTIHNPDLEVLQQNVDSLTQALVTQGAQLESFTHSQVLQELTGLSDLREYQSFISGKEDPYYQEFLDKEYEFDLRHTAHQFLDEGDLGPVWLDIQSFNFEHDVISLANAAQEVAPDMPILSVFPNAGNWRADTQPLTLIPDKTQLLTHIIGAEQIAQRAETVDDWVRRLHRAKNEKLVDFLEGVTDQEIVIGNGYQKTLFVRYFFSLVFGFDPLPENENAT